MTTIGNRIKFGIVYDKNKKNPLIVSEATRFVFARSSIQVDPLEVVYTCYYKHSEWTDIEVDTAKHLEINVDTTSYTVGSKEEVKESYKSNTGSGELYHNYYPGGIVIVTKEIERKSKKYASRVLEGIFSDLDENDEIYSYISDLLTDIEEVDETLKEIAKLDKRRYKSVTTDDKMHRKRMFSRAMAIYAPLLLVDKNTPVTQEVYVENDEDIPFWMFTFKEALKLLVDNT